MQVHDRRAVHRKPHPTKVRKRGSLDGCLRRADLTILEQAGDEGQGGSTIGEDKARTKRAPKPHQLAGRQVQEKDVDRKKISRICRSPSGGLFQEGCAEIGGS